MQLPKHGRNFKQIMGTQKAKLGTGVKVLGRRKSRFTISDSCASSLRPHRASYLHE